MNIMIVDDEVEIREGLRVMLERSGSSCRVVAVCAGGQEALEALTLHRVDALLTDIRMPRMDGLQLIELAKARCPTLQTAVLSGYSEFQYVQRALKLDACDYLLKPVREEELLAVLERLRERCRGSREARIYMDEERFRQEQRGCAAMLAIDVNAADGTGCPVGGAWDGTGGPVRGAWDGTDKPWSGPEADTEPAATTLLGPDRGEASAGDWPAASQMSGVDELGAVLRAIATAQSGDVYLLTGLVKPSTAAIVGLYGESEVAVASRTAAIAEAIRAHGRAAGRVYGIGISDTRCEPGHGHTLYLHACTALAGRMLTPGERFAYARRPFDERDYRLDLSRIDAAWETLDFESIYGELERLLDAAAESGDIGYLIWSSHTLLLALSEKVKTYNHVSPAVSYDFSAFLFKLLWCRSLAELRRFMTERASELFRLLSTGRREGQIIRRAKQYIRERLHEPLSLADIGREVCVSVSYLSRLFREQTGGTFLEFLTGQRIERAKELLSGPGVKVYEVAEQVGYGSWKHFSRIFKEATGMTPAEYKQHLSIQR
ncbi:response regulator [Cohnella sp. GCM10020058]|uniref:response regulator n=1 Tax=Cohnella sp. GCM10020058 TaxID=3317330 RepID=UPI00362EBFF7